MALTTTETIPSVTCAFNLFTNFSSKHTILNTLSLCQLDMTSRKSIFK
jgi:hypothetical protein